MTAGPTSHGYVSQRLRLHYVDWGNPEAPPLLLVHGGRDHCRNWDWVAQQFRDDWHVIAPDLRGHGDSQWASDGSYDMAAHVYDLAQLIHQQGLAPATIIGHSLGGNIAIRYTALYPASVSRLVAIEGLGSSPRLQARQLETPLDARLRRWIDEQRALAGRQPRRYPTVDDALRRMQEENRHLSPDQARHLTLHGVNRNEDGSFSWKFDNYVRSWPPVDLAPGDLQALWARITCPTLLVYGRESWASNPAADGRADHFRNAEVALVDGAGHWVHHDRLEAFVDRVKAFLGGPPAR